MSSRRSRSCEAVAIIRARVECEGVEHAKPRLSFGAICQCPLAAWAGGTFNATQTLKSCVFAKLNEPCAVGDDCAAARVAQREEAAS